MIETLNAQLENDSHIAFVGDFAFPFSASAVANVDSVKEITGADVVVGNLESSMVPQDRRRKSINLYPTISLKPFMAKQGTRVVSLANNYVVGESLAVAESITRGCGST